MNTHDVVRQADGRNGARNTATVNRVADVRFESIAAQHERHELHAAAAALRATADERTERRRQGLQELSLSLHLSLQVDSDGTPSRIAQLALRDVGQLDECSDSVRLCGPRHC